MRRLTWERVLALLVPIATLACGPSPSKPTGWNVLLVSVDTLRADHVSAYGSRVSKTPGIDRIAAGGILFEDVTTVAPSTLPAHASLMTGTSPLSHGVHDNIGFYLSRNAQTLATHLQDHGYETAAFVGSFVLDRRFGLDRGFQVYDDELGKTAEEMPGGLVAQRRGDEVLRRALSWLEGRSKDKPFFAFVHFYDPHTPYEPPEGFSTGDDDSLSLYRGEVAFVDSLVGRLLDWLRSRHLNENTLVVLTADHGESLGEHGELTHGYFLYQSTLRIPLLLKYPGSPRGARIRAPVRILDVAPTVVELLGLPPMARTEGTSLASLVRDGDAGERPSAYSEAYLARLHYGFAELRSLRRGTMKYIDAPRPELYDLNADPGESRNLVEEEPELARSMREELLERIDRNPTSVTPSPVDAEARRRLESLGYAGGSASGRGATRTDPKDGLDVYLTVNDPVYESVSPDDREAFTQALRRLEEARKEAPTVPRIYLLLGELQLKANRPHEAEEAFEELVKLDPEGFQGRYGLGVARARQGKAEAAIEALEKARTLEPRNTKAYFELAEVEAARGNRVRAEDWLRRALEIHEDPFLAARLAQLLVEEGKGGEAIRRLSELAKAHVHDAGFAYELGQVLLGQGQLDRAVTELRRASSLAPEDPDIQLALANALAGTGQTDEAVASYQRALALSPCFAPAHSNLGSTYAQLGRLEEAARCFEKAVSCDPGYVIGYKNLAAVRLQQGDVSRAVAAMKSAVGASPEDRELKQKLDELLAYQRSRK